MDEYEQGEVVLFHAPAFFRERRVGVIIEPCKDHDGGIKVAPLDSKSSPYSDVCVNREIGDTIERLENLNHP